ncbi:MAG: hypothetical protein FJ218_01640 [Ignavibacteria bacterium]|nr:hypothetical protein [Ignavibacteria bacterium]
MFEKKQTILFFLFFFIAFNISRAQFVEDAYRLASSGEGISARSLGMGNAFVGVANDFSASFWNPAGLGLLQHSEISFNFSNFIFSDKSTYLTSQEEFSNSSTNVNSVGFVFPLPTYQGSFVVGLGFSQTKNFTTGLKFSGFNTKSSIIQNWAKDGLTFPLKNDGYQSLAYQLYLANINTSIIGNDTTYFFDSPIKNNVQQSGSLFEDGGMSRWTLSVSVEAAPQLFLGGTLNIIRGDYKYIQNYSEYDAQNLYQASPFDFTHLNVEETISEDIGGFDAQIGLLYNFNNISTIGIKIQTPTILSIEEEFRILRESNFTAQTVERDSRVFFDEPERNEPPDKTSFDVTSPFQLSVGGSLYIENLLLSASSEFSDWTQMNFSDVPPQLEYLNTEIKERFRTTLSYRVGVDYEFQKFPISLRSGLMFFPSAYKNDPNSFAKKYITVGAGYVLQDAIAVDIAYANGFWDSFSNAPDKGFTIQEKITTHTIFATITYRY